MKKITALFIGFIIIFLTAMVFAGGNEPTNKELLEEIRDLKTRVLELETNLMKQDQKIQKNESQTKEMQDKVENIDTNLTRKEETLPSLLSEGFKINADATMVLQGTDEINQDTSSENNAATDVSYDIDLQFEKAFEDYGKAYMELDSGKGNGIEDDLKVFSNVNSTTNNNENVRVTKFWYEQYFNNPSLVLTFGKLDPTGYFDTNALANDEETQFLGRIFTNSSVIEFPDNTMGIRLGVSPIKSLEIDLGFFDADADWEQIFDSGFFTGQLNFKPNLFEKNGNYRLLGWLSDRKHTKWTDTANDQEPTYGLGLSFDQELTDNLAVFFRYGWQNPDYYLNGQTYSLESSWSTGLQIKGGLWGRDNDVWGFALGQIYPSNKYKNSNPILNATAEGHFETYYNFRINDHLTIGPDIQKINNPYGDDANNESEIISVYGLRAQIDF